MADHPFYVRCGSRARRSCAPSRRLTFLQARESSTVESSTVESPTSGLAAAVTTAAQPVASQP
eukprot:4513739-Prymnesium_polylepis.1